MQLIWATHYDWPVPPGAASSQRVSGPLHISILDSSFNPPTYAHLALATSPFPDQGLSDPAPRQHGYDAHLLLLSVRNADKTIKHGDADHVQRVEMMILLAKEMAAVQPQSEIPNSSASLRNVGVAVIDEPTFVGKSNKVLAYLDGRLQGRSRALNERVSSTALCQLTFILGYDTLLRLFEPRFYGSRDSMGLALLKFFAGYDEGGDNSIVVCSRRFSNNTLVADDPSGTREENQFLMSEDVTSYVKRGLVIMMDIGSKEQRMSSTQVRVASGSSAEGHLIQLCPRLIVEYIQKVHLYSEIN